MNNDVIFFTLTSQWLYNKNRQRKIAYVYIYIYICIFFSPVKPESGIIQLGQLDYSNFEYLNIPGKELNVTKWSDFVFLKDIYIYIIQLKMNNAVQLFFNPPFQETQIKILMQITYYHIYQPLRSGRIWHKVNF